MTFLESLRERAKARSARLVFPEGADPRIQAAAVELANQDLARPVLLGSQADLERSIAELGGDHRVEVVDPTADVDRYGWTVPAGRPRRGSQGPAVSEPDALEFAALMVAHGQADGMVAGAVYTTADVVRAVLRHIGLTEGIRTLSSSFYMIVPPFRSEHSEVLTFTDAGVVPDPDPLQLVEIAVAAADARRRLVGDEPRLAFLSYSTHGSGRGSSVRKVRKALAMLRTSHPDLMADGELQGDAALMASVARRKAPGSTVAGRANVLVFPNLDSANIAYKLVQRLAGAAALGPILQGARRPCNDLSRGVTTEDIQDVACITAVLS